MEKVYLYCYEFKKESMQEKLVAIMDITNSTHEEVCDVIDIQTSFLNRFVRLKRIIGGDV